MSRCKPKIHDLLLKGTPTLRECPQCYANLRPKPTAQDIVIRIPSSDNEGNPQAPSRTSSALLMPVKSEYNMTESARASTSERTRSIASTRRSPKPLTVNIGLTFYYGQHYFEPNNDPILASIPHNVNITQVGAYGTARYNYQQGFADMEALIYFLVQKTSLRHELKHLPWKVVTSVKTGTGAKGGIVELAQALEGEVTFALLLQMATGKEDPKVEYNLSFFASTEIPAPISKHIAYDDGSPITPTPKAKGKGKQAASVKKEPIPTRQRRTNAVKSEQQRASPLAFRPASPPLIPDPTIDSSPLPSPSTLVRTDTRQPEEEVEEDMAGEEESATEEEGILAKDGQTSTAELNTRTAIPDEEGDSPGQDQRGTASFTRKTKPRLPPFTMGLREGKRGRADTISKDIPKRQKKTNE